MPMMLSLPMPSARRGVVLAMLAGWLAATPAGAQDVGIDAGPIDTPETADTAADPAAADAAAPEVRWRVGLGVGVRPDYLGSNDYEAVPLPQLTVSRGPQYVNITGAYLFSNALPSPNWRLGPTAKFIRGDRCNADDGRVNAMRCQADAVMLGATGGYSFVIPGLGGPARLAPELEILGDAAGANDGYTIEPQLNYTQRLSDDWRLGLRGFGTWASENYNDYYFGVTRFQANQSGLPQYSADSGFYQVGLLGVADYDITEHWKLSLIGRYARMIGDAEDSPIVDGDQGRGSANQFLAGIVAAYVF